ncbi:hypothetical protein [Deinococcus sp.]|uniref:hypothetical protein n=1 Tax=Deinococcus sp. TaxID=47478 RepID=UPI003CC50DD8
MKKLLLTLPIMFLAACGQVGTSSVPAETFSASSDIAPADVDQAVAWAKARTILLLAQDGVLQTQQLASPKLMGTMTSSANCETVSSQLPFQYYCDGRKLYFDADKKRPPLPNL